MYFGFHGKTAMIVNAVEDSADEIGWAPLAAVGQNVAKKRADFDPRNYGYRNLSELMKTLDDIDVELHGKVVYVKVNSKAQRRRFRK